LTFINNGIKQIFINPNEIETYLGKGWILGTLQKNKTTNSSHCNTVWVNNTFTNKRIKSDQLELIMSSGWKLGRIGLKKYKKK